VLSSIGVGWACLFLCTCVLPWHALVASRRPTTSGSVRIGASAAAVEGRPWVGVTMIPEVFWAQRGEGDWLTGWMLCRMNPLERPAVAPAATPLQQQQEREREQKAAEAQAGEAAIVKQLQEENAELKGRVAALEKVLEKDGLQGLIQEALAAAGKTAAGDPTTHSPDPHATLDNQPARRARRVCRVCRSFGRIVRGFCTAGQRRFQPLGPRPGRRFHPVC